MYAPLDATPEHRWTIQAALVAIIPSLVIAAMVMFATPTLMLDDALAHVAIGQWIIAHGAVPRADPFSYTMTGAPWNAHEWLSEVLMAFAYRLGGVSGLDVLFGLACAATAFFFARSLLRFLPPIPALTALMLPLAYVHAATEARPHILVLPLTAFWMAELLAARDEQRAPRWILIPLMALWVNLHGSFILGLILLLPFALEAAIDAKKEWLGAVKSWSLVAAGTLLAALANPAGVSGLLFPLKLMGMPSLMGIREWKSAVFVPLDQFEACLLAALFFCLTLGVRVPAIRLLTLLGLLHEALQHRRHILILVLLGAMLLAEPVGAALKARARPAVPNQGALRAIGTGALALLFFLSVTRLAVTEPLRDNDYTPVTAFSHIPEAVLREPVFNDYEMGAYLIFRGVRPFIDGRADMYGEAFMADYSKIVDDGDMAALEQTFARYRIGWTLLNAQNRFNATLDRLPGWRILYQDKFAAVHVRAER